ncbi:uncharacterized protein LOC132904347 isoform X2 [Amyelois transitella]|uniref:uncharacterized protein LOC132903904 n=1 Tax=Amyelois transitella TaxID=680683 RepID=UPI00298F6967|nr:uncharacterized protein LOC132901876 isoform X2 [Amyelois transitella]XP_060801218.1 uncharacterized protein LOC132901933 isoform X2 [Amyelois transitella]XP_060802081.1 uncharacterized protein LOC132902135 isoform X2 [Amyelois transitella]XP_060804334.1 uncharacterized protein LOC132902560 isoform X2 [Amyelois transitella]XP_060805907.1 uncharacterized protein LOC132902929 isoform X2 [Amyelois transitella]XP_060805909.1 uncharacterized protein LOC132902930 isoform X2 [Amyelois transitella]
MEPQTPSTSRSMFVGLEVTRTPQGSLIRGRDVVLETSGSGRIRPWRPQNLSVEGEAIEIVDELVHGGEKVAAVPEERTKGQPRNLFGREPVSFIFITLFESINYLH